MFCIKSRSKSWSPNEALQGDQERVKRLSNLLKLRSEHDQAVAKTGWDSYQRELVSLFLEVESQKSTNSIIS